METIEKLQKILQDVFDDETLVIDEHTSAEDIAEWDSFSHIHLCAAVEKEFGIRMTTEQAIRVKSIQDFLRIIEENHSGTL
ncbi:acyl carrier protein [Flexilinea flocculi]|jgi:acyl carrier protein|uniref:Acyl carrier protein n=1 Tax=Flexilinea flocculi TaxID=1678840 RepID=A0A0K8P903_9CHLR|nr:acyl carrier protein [Flexilinea flocculi]NMB94404.1 acyl carrier protein [Flexilinea flocculi]GAP39128.1 acyl carrier protein [Flexilinea flocculi]